MHTEPTGRSDDAQLLAIMQRAMRRTDAELFGNRWRYEARARQLAERLIGRGCEPLSHHHEGPTHDHL